MSWCKCMKISFDNVYEDPLVELDELEFAYCLPNFILDLCTIQTETNSKDKGQKTFSMETPIILTKT